MMNALTAQQKMVSASSDPDSSGYRAMRCHAEVGFQKLGEQEPYFHALAAIDRKLKNNRWESSYPNRWGGPCADHESFREFFPAIAHLAQYHLWGVDSGPMHYVANATYWAREYRNARAACRDADAVRHLAAFRRQVGFGLLPYEQADEEDGCRVVAQWDEDMLKLWLEARLPKLIAKFHADVEAWQPGLIEKARNLGK